MDDPVPYDTCGIHYCGSTVLLLLFDWSPVLRSQGSQPPGKSGKPGKVREKSGNLIGGQGKCLEISVMFWSTYTGRGVHSLLTMKQSALLKK